IYASGEVTATSVTPGNLPTNGETLHARLFTVYGSTQVYIDYTFTAATQAALTAPAPSSVLTGPEVTFDWTAAPGATGYAFRIGTTVGANNIYASGEVTATSVTPENLPTNGETLYVRLFTVYGSSQVYIDYTFTAYAQPAVLTSPAPSSVLTGPEVTFVFTDDPGATGYALRIGTTVVANNIYASGEVTATSVTPDNLPTNGETLHVRLFTV